MCNWKIYLVKNEELKYPDIHTADKIKTSFQMVHSSCIKNWRCWMSWMMHWIHSLVKHRCLWHLALSVRNGAWQKDDLLSRSAGTAEGLGGVYLFVRTHHQGWGSSGKKYILMGSSHNHVMHCNDMFGYKDPAYQIAHFDSAQVITFE